MATVMACRVEAMEMLGWEHLGSHYGFSDKKMSVIGQFDLQGPYLGEALVHGEDHWRGVVLREDGAVDVIIAGGYQAQCWLCGGRRDTLAVRECSECRP